MCHRKGPRFGLGDLLAGSIKNGDQFILTGRFITVSQEENLENHGLDQQNLVPNGQNQIIKQGLLRAKSRSRPK